MIGIYTHHTHTYTPHTHTHMTTHPHIHMHTQINKADIVLQRKNNKPHQSDVYNIGALRGQVASGLLPLVSVPDARVTVWPQLYEARERMSLIN